jgi:hypothetical protein
VSRRGRKVGYARVHGSVKPWRGWRAELRSAVRRRVRRKVDAVTGAVTLRSQREELARKTAAVGRKVHAVLHPLERSYRSTDAGAPQVTAGCVVSPEKFIGKRPLTRASHSRGYCHGCGLELPLTIGGKIPPHKPGPPPVRDCPSCGAWLPAHFPALKVKGRPREEWGAYNALQCPLCVDATADGRTAQEQSWS